MSFTNINDPEGLKALLEQLRSSQAWQDLSNTSTRPAAGPNSSLTSAAALEPSGRNASTACLLDVQDTSVVSSSSLLPSEPTVPPDQAEQTPSVASLLSQLQAPSAPLVSIHTPNSEPPISRYAARPPAPYTPAADPPPTRNCAPASSTPAPPSPGPPFCAEDLRTCTFQQALLHLARLAEDPGFASAISILRREQADLERQLWEERCAIVRKHEEKVKVARAKANMIGGGLTQFEADMMSDTFRKELLKFDAERVLPAWDGLVTKQQHKLESLGVPAMYQTTIAADRERQQRVMQVLAGIASNE